MTEDCLVVRARFCVGPQLLTITSSDTARKASGRDHCIETLSGMGH